jgi:hypothetical protein
MGETCIPDNVERVVALEESDIDGLLALEDVLENPRESGMLSPNNRITDTTPRSKKLDNCIPRCVFRLARRQVGSTLTTTARPARCFPKKRV